VPGDPNGSTLIGRTYQSNTANLYRGFHLKPTRRSILIAGLAQSALAQVRLPRKVRLGLIGFDGHVGEILRVLPQFPDVELVAVADAASDPVAIASNVQNKYVAAARRYATTAALLNREKLDAAAVCNNDGDRAGAIQACARERIHVIAEKPLVIDRAGLDLIYKVVNETKIRLGMLLPMRFDPPYLAMKRIVASGEIGQALQIDAQKSYQLGERPEWQKHAASYGSTILWIGIHMIDLMTSVSSRRFTEVASFQGRIGFPELRDMETVTASVFRMDNGGTATLRMDYLRPATEKEHGDDRLRIAGTRGVIEFQERTGVVLSTDREGSRTISPLPEQKSVFADFLQSTFMGTAPELTWKEIVQANEYTLAAHEAAMEHRIVKMRSL
jgi:predicted dehydrogenase